MSAPTSNIYPVTASVSGYDSLAAKGADIASASTTNLAAATGPFVNVTGTATIDSFGTAPAGTRRLVRFTGAGTITFNLTSMILPNNNTLERDDGDCALFESLGSGNWRCLIYQRYNGTPVSLDNYLFDQNLNTTDEVEFQSIAHPGGAVAIDLNDPNKVILHPDTTAFFFDDDGYHGLLAQDPSVDTPTTPGSVQGWIQININGVGLRFIPYYGNPP